MNGATAGELNGRRQHYLHFSSIERPDHCFNAAVILLVPDSLKPSEGLRPVRYSQLTRHRSLQNAEFQAIKFDVLAPAFAKVLADLRWSTGVVCRRRQFNCWLRVWRAVRDLGIGEPGSSEDGYNSAAC